MQNNKKITIYIIITIIFCTASYFLGNYNAWKEAKQRLVNNGVMQNDDTAYNSVMGTVISFDNEKITIRAYPLNLFDSSTFLERIIYFDKNTEFFKGYKIYDKNISLGKQEEIIKVFDKPIHFFTEKSSIGDIFEKQTISVFSDQNIRFEKNIKATKIILHE